MGLILKIFSSWRVVFWSLIFLKFHSHTSPLSPGNISSHWLMCEEPIRYSAIAAVSPVSSVCGSQRSIPRTYSGAAAQSFSNRTVFPKLLTTVWSSWPLTLQTRRLQVSSAARIRARKSANVSQRKLGFFSKTTAIKFSSTENDKSHFTN